MRGRVNGFAFDVVSDSTPKVSRIWWQVMYFEGMEFVLRSGLKNVESCGREVMRPRHGARQASSVSQAEIAAGRSPLDGLAAHDAVPVVEAV